MKVEVVYMVGQVTTNLVLISTTNFGTLPYPLFF